MRNFNWRERLSSYLVGVPRTTDSTEPTTRAQKLGPDWETSLP